MTQHLRWYCMQKNFLKNLYQKAKTIYKLHLLKLKKV